MIVVSEVFYLLDALFDKEISFFMSAELMVKQKQYDELLREYTWKVTLSLL